jgi:hypothetical protein
MKIVATVTDCGDMIHTGAPLTAKSSIINIPDECVPEIVRDYFKNLAWMREDMEHRSSYRSLSFSLFVEAQL